MARDFAQWLLTFTDSIANYKYYIDFETIYKNAEEHKIELNMMNSLIGSKTIENDFEKLVIKYPEVIKCIPTLLAVRQYEIIVLDDEGNKLEYNFKNMNYSIDQYKVFMRETGLFNLLEKHLVNNLYDYVLGVESGLNSNARKNRGGHLMEDVVERFIQKAGFKKNETYFKEMYLQDIEQKWKLDMSFISNKNTSTKRFDFVVKTDNCIYGIETNFYASGGSKLNETARSYKMIAEEADKVVGFEFVWFTDGMGWISARNNLRETFDNMDNIFNINDMKNGMTIIMDGNLYTIVEFQHVKPGKGPAFVRIKYRDLRTGSTIEDTFNTNLKLEKAHVEKMQMQFLYKENDNYVFMNTNDYSQMEVSSSIIGDDAKFLKEGLVVNVMNYNGEIVGVTFPDKISYKVVETEQAVKGNTTSGAQKDATLETGYTVKVPLFIEAGEEIIITTSDGKYSSRA